MAELKRTAGLSRETMSRPYMSSLLPWKNLPRRVPGQMVDVAS